MTLLGDDVRGFLRRDWDLVASTKNAFWTESSATPAERLRLADALRRYVTRLRPDWPAEEDRDADAASHARVARALRRVGTARSR